MSDYGTILYTGAEGPTNYYTGAGTDQPQNLDFYRTNIDGDYVFHWTFLQSFVSTLINPAFQQPGNSIDYVLQLDTNPTFNLPTTFDTITEAVDVFEQGYTRSAFYPATNISAGLTLIINIDGDGVRTITLGADASGAAIAADIQAKVQALTAINPALQASYNNFTAQYDSIPSSGYYTTYKLSSGGVGIASTVSILGGTASPSLKLGLTQGGVDVGGDTLRFITPPGEVLTIFDDSHNVYTDVSSTTNVPGLNQYVVSIPLGVVTFNAGNLSPSMHTTFTIIYYPSTSAPILNFQDGNVEKGFTVPVPPRIASAPVTFYARVAIKYGPLSYGTWSSTLKVLTIPNVINETFSRLMLALPDFHVYPIDNAYLLNGSLVDGIIPNPLPPGLSNIAKVYLAYATQFDLEYLEKENAIRDVRQDRQRDDRLGSILGALYHYPQPDGMQNVDYRLILSNMKAASLDGATYEAVKLVSAAFTGVDPTIFPISKILNFITAGFNNNLTGVNYPGVVQNVTVDPLAYMATLSSGVANDPIIPGSLISGPVVTITDGPELIPSVAPFTLTLAQLPANIPTIVGYTFVTGAPAINQFSVDFAAPGKSISGVSPATTTTGLAFNVNINGDGIQTVTIGAQSSGANIAAAIQAAIRLFAANTPFNQAAIDTTTVVYTTVYTLTSGAGGLNSSVVITGLGAAPLKLGQANGGTETGPSGVVTFNPSNAGDSISVTYIPNYERGNNDVTDKTLIINVDGLGPQTITLVANAANGYLATKTGVALAIQTAVNNLGSAPATTQLALLASATITNTGASIINGDVDLTPGSSVTGFPPGIINGTLNIDNAAAMNAMTAANATYAAVVAASAGYTSILPNLDSQILVPGNYKTGAGAHLATSGSATLTFNGAGNYVIYCSSTLTTGAGGTPTMTLTGGATAANILWVIGSSATLNVNPGIFEGNLIAQASVTLDSGSAIGQLSALTGAITISTASTVTGSTQATSPSEATAYTDFIAVYNSATDQFTLVSGNQSPTQTSTVVVTGGTAATQLRLLAADGATQTYGLSYETPPTVPAPGQFINNIVLPGNGSVLTFNADEADNEHTVLFLPVTDIFTYLPKKVSQSLTVSAIAPYTITLPSTLGGGSPYFNGGSRDIPIIGEMLLGTVQVTQNSINVVGTGTTFTTSFSVGAKFVTIVAGVVSSTYTIASIADDTHLTLTSTYTEHNAATAGYSNLSEGTYLFVPTRTVAGAPISGTISVTNGSLLVIGTATTFTTVLSVGQAIQFGSQQGTLYFIESIIDDTNLTLETNYTGITTASTVIDPPGLAPFPVVLAPNQFTDDFNSPATLTFNAAAASDTVVVSYTVQVPIQDIDTVNNHPILFSGTEAGFGIEIILNNPAMFSLDLKTISFLLTEILPANTKFILTEVS